MSSFCSLHRLPRAGVDPIDSAEVAMSMVSLMTSDPLRHETIVLLLDDRRCGIGVLVVTGTVPYDAMFDVLDVVTDLDLDGVDSVVLASVRPPVGRADASDLDDRDIDRWLEASSLVDERGLELVEWFVIGRSVTCPREVFGEPARW